jgi:hypothetical protein
MAYDPRTIAFTAEILHPPQQLRAELVQSVHNALWRLPAVGYQNFQIAPDGIHLSNLPQTPGQVSSATFAWDRLVLREELRGTTPEDFTARMTHVVTAAYGALGIATSLAQQFTVRSLVAPRHYRDGREFLSRRLIAPGADAWQSFDRPLHSLGVRFESWPQDQRSIWLENTGSFPTPTTVSDVARLGQQLDATYRYLCGPVCAFLSTLDTP